MPDPADARAVTREDVLRLADLAKIDLADDEVDPLAADLAALLGYVRQLGEVDTDGVEPLDALGVGRLRDDVPGPVLGPGDLEWLNGYDPLSAYFPVPTVFGDGH